MKKGTAWRTNTDVLQKIWDVIYYIPYPNTILEKFMHNEPNIVLTDNDRITLFTIIMD